MKKLYTMENEYCTYAVDLEKRLLYVSLSFEDLSDLYECDDYFIVNIDEYVSDSDDDPIQELINKVK